MLSVFVVFIMFACDQSTQVDKDSHVLTFLTDYFCPVSTMLSKITCLLPIVILYVYTPFSNALTNLLMFRLRIEPAGARDIVDTY